MNAYASPVGARSASCALALMAPARRVMSHEYGSTQFDFKIQMSWFLPGSTSSSRNPILASKFHRHFFSKEVFVSTPWYSVI